MSVVVAACSAFRGIGNYVSKGASSVGNALKAYPEAVCELAHIAERSLSIVLDRPYTCKTKTSIIEIGQHHSSIEIKDEKEFERMIEEYLVKAGHVTNKAANENEAANDEDFERLAKEMLVEAELLLAMN